MLEKNWQNALIQRTSTVREAIRVIDASGFQIALVVDANMTLLGTVTDGDVRRALLRGEALDANVTAVMNPKPIVVDPKSRREDVLTKMKIEKLRQLPIVDEQRRVVGFEILETRLGAEEKPNWVVLMAGGLGSRLGPLTSERPKPLLHVGERPLLETILVAITEYGFKQFFIAVNYKADMIMKHFGDGSQWGATIRYLHEDQRLGTAGALSLLPERPKAPLIVMNGDLLTKVNFQQLLDFHAEHQAAATMCIRQYDFQVPFGVVTLDKHEIKAIDEKPLQHFFVNAGIYVLGPEAYDLVPKGQYWDMPQVFDGLIKRKMPTAAFPIREYWLDIGHLSDFERANAEYSKNFQ